MKNTGTGKAKKNQKRFWTVPICLLTLLVIVTAVILGNRLGMHSEDDRDVIALVPSEASEEKTAGKSQVDGNVTGAPSRGSSSSAGVKPGFEAEDSKTTWSTQTNVEIFKVSYRNGEGVITAAGADADKVIAPGTENAYTFRLKNTGNVAIDYDMTVEAYLSSENIELPVDARMKSYSGDYLAGGENTWDPVLKLNGITDRATLGVNRYAFYTLEWQWPFESGDDNYDTWLGNQAVGRDITLTVVIKTTASADADPNAGGGMVYTGDNADSMIYVLLATGAAAVILLILFFKRRKNEEKSVCEESENK